MPTGPDVAGMGLEKKPFSKRVGFGFSRQTHGSGSGIRKPAPNLTHYHSYSVLLALALTRSNAVS